LNYETLLEEADSQYLVVKEKPLRAHNGRIKGNRIAIKNDIPTTQKACVLAEELGHHYTTVGNILDQSKVENRKQERRARLWAYKRAFDLVDLVSAYKHGCRNRYEIAEYLEVTEQFLQEALDTYKEKYGIYTKIDRYVVYFEPLGILEMYE
jgi:hypothetical protein